MPVIRWHIFSTWCFQAKQTDSPFFMTARIDRSVWRRMRKSAFFPGRILPYKWSIPIERQGFMVAARTAAERGIPMETAVRMHS